MADGWGWNGGGLYFCGHTPTPPPPSPRPPPPPPSPRPPPLPPLTPGAVFVVAEGQQFCRVIHNMATGAECVTDGGGQYGNNENCIIRVLDTVHVTATQYEVETCCDYLTIGGTRYRGSTNAPTNVLMPAGSTMRWHTDFSVTSGGFTICATSAVANPPPPPAPHPPSGCNEGLWPGVYSPGGTCDTCKVLVQGFVPSTAAAT